MSYTLYFDLTQKVWTNFLTPVQLIPLSIGVVGIALNVSRKRRGLPAYSWSSSPDKPAHFLPYLFLGIGLLTSWMTFRDGYLAYTELRAEYDAGKCEIIEGKIENLVLHKKKGDPPSSFDVWPKHYPYRRWLNTAAFHVSGSDNAPIKEGLQVRITDCSGAIVKLEIEKDVPAAQAIVDTPNAPVAKPSVSDNKAQ